MPKSRGGLVQAVIAVVPGWFVCLCSAQSSVWLVRGDPSLTKPRTVQTALYGSWRHSCPHDTLDRIQQWAEEITAVGRG